MSCVVEKPLHRVIAIFQVTDARCRRLSPSASLRAAPPRLPRRRHSVRLLANPPKVRGAGVRANPIHVKFVSFPELFASSKDRRSYPMGLVNQLLITATPDHQKSLEGTLKFYRRRQFKLAPSAPLLLVRKYAEWGKLDEALKIITNKVSIMSNRCVHSRSLP